MNFEFLLGLSLSKMTVSELRKHVTNLGLKYNKDLGVAAFVNEVESFKFSA